MPSIEFTVNIFYIIVMVVLAFCAGFFMRRVRRESYMKRIEQLETEIRNNHADILELQEEKAALELKISQAPAPFVPSENEEKIPEASPRKKFVTMQEINDIREHGSSSTV